METVILELSNLGNTCPILWWTKHFIHQLLKRNQRAGQIRRILIYFRTLMREIEIFQRYPTIRIGIPEITVVLLRCLDLSAPSLYQNIVLEQQTGFRIWECASNIHWKRNRKSPWKFAYTPRRKIWNWDFNKPGSSYWRFLCLCCADVSHGAKLYTNKTN